MSDIDSDNLNHVRPGPVQSNSGNRQQSAEQQVLQGLVSSIVTEQRRGRRWGVFFKALFFIYIFALGFLLIPQDGVGTIESQGKHTALVDLNDVISQESQASADILVSGLRAAYDNPNVVAVILRANSPGGSPVQAAYVYDEITRLRESNPDVPLYTVITDACASACYYIASASERIYANPASLVGSIGVLHDGFGYTGLLEKLGVERRLLTAGKHKGLLDPFSPMNKGETAHIQSLLDDIHVQFIDAVRKGRDERLKENDELFSGLMWTGRASLELGLIDSFASPGQVARDVIGEEDIVSYTVEESWFSWFARELGASMGRGVLSAFKDQVQFY